MWKYGLFIILSLHISVIQNLPVNNTTMISFSNDTQQQKSEIRNSIANNTSEISKIPVNANTTSDVKAEIIHNEEESKTKTENDFTISSSNPGINNDDLDEYNFKYYWIILVGSSLTIISLIIFKSFRMRRSRAEVRYGKPNEKEEIEPLGKSKWENDDSSENEDEIFDINFLKNTRLQTYNDN